MNFRKATIEDLDILVATRIEVLRAANRLDATDIANYGLYRREHAALQEYKEQQNKY